jgi:hypothetical protein
MLDALCSLQISWHRLITWYAVRSAIFNVCLKHIYSVHDFRRMQTQDLCYRMALSVE